MRIVESLMEMWVGCFHAKGEIILPFFVNGTLPQRIWLSRYEKVEPMTKKEEKEMIAYCREMFPEKTEDELYISAKIVHALGCSL